MSIHQSMKFTIHFTYILKIIYPIVIEHRNGKCYALKGNICKVLCMEQIKKRKTINSRTLSWHIVLMLVAKS